METLALHYSLGAAQLC